MQTWWPLASRAGGMVCVPPLLSYQILEKGVNGRHVEL